MSELLAAITRFVDAATFALMVYVSLYCASLLWEVIQKHLATREYLSKVEEYVKRQTPREGGE